MVHVRQLVCIPFCRKRACYIGNNYIIWFTCKYRTHNIFAIPVSLIEHIDAAHMLLSAIFRQVIKRTSRVNKKFLHRAKSSRYSANSTVFRIILFCISVPLHKVPRILNRNINQRIRRLRVCRFVAPAVPCRNRPSFCFFRLLPIHIQRTLFPHQRPAFLAARVCAPCVKVPPRRLLLRYVWS